MNSCAQVREQCCSYSKTSSYFSPWVYIYSIELLTVFSLKLCFKIKEYIQQDWTKIEFIKRGKIFLTNLFWRCWMFIEKFLTLPVMNHNYNNTTGICIIYICMYMYIQIHTHVNLKPIVYTSLKSTTIYIIISKMANQEKIEMTMRIAALCWYICLCFYIHVKNISFSLAYLIHRRTNVDGNRIWGNRKVRLTWRWVNEEGHPKKLYTRTCICLFHNGNRAEQAQTYDELVCIFFFFYRLPT